MFKSPSLRLLCLNLPCLNLLSLNLLSLNLLSLNLLKPVLTFLLTQKATGIKGNLRSTDCEAYCLTFSSKRPKSFILLFYILKPVYGVINPHASHLFIS